MSGIVKGWGAWPPVVDDLRGGAIHRVWLEGAPGVEERLVILPAGTYDDLLAALKELVDIEGPLPGTQAWHARATAAIAKAEEGA